MSFSTSNFKSSSLIVIFVAFIAGSFIVACGEADDDHDHSSSNDEEALVSEDGHFAIDFTADPDPPTTGDNTLIIHLVDSEAGEAITGAELEVEPWMPGHGHGSPQVPSVTEEGDGEYLVENIYYSMPGYWELHIDVTDNGTTDTFTIAFDVE